nr:hypothetical protein [uncultured Flavobacterium sp.]
MNLKNSLVIKKFFTPIFFLLLVVLIGAIFPHEYKKYVLFIVLPFAIAKIAADLIKSRKRDKLNQTNNFWFCLLNLTVTIAVLLVLWFAIKG